MQFDGSVAMQSVATGTERQEQGVERGKLEGRGGRQVLVYQADAGAGVLKPDRQLLCPRMASY